MQVATYTPRIFFFCIVLAKNNVGWGVYFGLAGDANRAEGDLTLWISQREVGGLINHIITTQSSSVICSPTLMTRQRKCNTVAVHVHLEEGAVRFFIPRPVE